MFVLQFPNSYPGHILPNMYFLVSTHNQYSQRDVKHRQSETSINESTERGKISKDKIDPKPSNLVFGSIKPQSFVYKEEEEKPLGKQVVFLLSLHLSIVFNSRIQSNYNFYAVSLGVLQYFSFVIGDGAGCQFQSQDLMSLEILCVQIIDNSNGNM